MKKKIESYIAYEFRNIEKTDEVLEAMEEAYANLSDLYEDLIAKGKDQEEAYIETIKRLGEFSKEFTKKEKVEYAVKPKWADTLLVISVVFGIASLPVLFLNLLIGSLLLMVSAGCFSVSAYFLYENANFALVEKKDLYYHNHTLEKIYKFVRLNKNFWMISISLIIALVFNKLIIELFSWVFYIATPEFDVDLLIDFETRAKPLFALLLFIIILPICLIVGQKQYNKALRKYVDLTGNTHIGKVFLIGSYPKVFAWLLVALGTISLLLVVWPFYKPSLLEFKRISFLKKKEFFQNVLQVFIFVVILSAVFLLYDLVIKALIDLMV
jgi:preprotein translocase SecE subunit